MSSAIGACLIAAVDVVVNARPPRNDRGYADRAPAPLVMLDAAGAVTVTLHSAVLAGSAIPGTWVSANLTRREAEGDRHAFGDAFAGAGGGFSITLKESAGGPELPVAAGDRLIVAFGTGAEPLTLIVPSVQAFADPLADTVSGITVPYAPVGVTVEGAPGVRRRTVADGGGGFAVALGGDVDLQPGSSGTVDVELVGEDAVVLPWAVPRVDLVVGEPVVSGRAAVGARVEIALYRRGQPAAAGSAMAAPGAAGGLPNWSVILRDDNGEPVDMQADDRLAVATGGWSAGIDVPRLAAEGNAATDVLYGAGPPGKPVAVSIARGPERVDGSVAAGPDGRFAWDLAGRWDLRPRDAVALALTMTHGSAVAATRVPGLSVDLDSGRVGGNARPYRVVRATLRDGGRREVAAGEATADDHGRFGLDLRAEGGEAFSPRAGDALEVSADAVPSVVTVPAVALEIDPSVDRVRGIGPAGAEITLTAVHALGGLRAVRVRRAAVEADGRFDASWSGDLDLTAGTLVRAAIGVPDGVTFEMAQRQPLAAAQRGGNLVSGFVGAGAATRLSVRRAGVLLVEVAGVAQADGAFVAQVAGPGGEPLVLRADDAIEMTWTGGDMHLAPPQGQILARVAPLTATLRLDMGLVDGLAPPSARVFVGPEAAGGSGATRRVQADPDGRFAIDVAAVNGPGDVPAGRGFEVGLADPDGHQTLVRLVAPYVEVTLGDPRVAARSAPMGWARLRLASGAREIAAGAGRADTFGHVAALLKDDQQRPVPPVSGNVLALGHPADPSVSIVLPPLSIAIDIAGGRLNGRAPARADVTVQLQLAGRPDASLSVRADAGGAWTIRAADLPAGVALADVVTAEARVLVAPGHAVRAIVATLSTPTATAAPGRTPSSATPTRAATGSATPTPTRASSATATPDHGATVWLPMLSRNWRASGRTQ